MPVGGAAGRAVDLAGIAGVEEGSGVVWTQDGSVDLNANLVRFAAGEGVGLHANGEVDVVFVGVSGSGTVAVDGEEFVLEPGRMVLVPKGCWRATRSGSGGFSYLTVHRRRGPLRIAARAPGWRNPQTRDDRKEEERTERHPALRKFSDDHHDGLVQAGRLRRTVAGEGVPAREAAQEAARGFLRFWERSTSPHFRTVEEVLLAVFARHGGDLDAEPIREMVAGHARIRGLAMTLSGEHRSGAVGTDTLREIGERLEAHVRLEERSVFPLIEGFLSEEALGEVASRLGTFGCGPGRDPDPGKEARTTRP